VITERLANELLTYWTRETIPMMNSIQIELARLLVDDWHLSLIELEEAVRALVP
jgi:hypothetical protein